MREVLLCTNPLLRKVATPVVFDSTLPDLLKEMVSIMRTSNGCGLAAPQIGISKQIVVVEEPEKEPAFFINPNIYWYSDEKELMEEGCLSLPGIRAEIERYLEIKLAYQNIEGTTCNLYAKGVLAHILQHEIDHLNGKLFIDYLSPFKRSYIMKKMQKEGRMRSMQAMPVPT